MWKHGDSRGGDGTAPSWRQEARGEDVMRRLWAMAALAVAGALGAPTGLAAAGSAPSEPVPTRAHAAPARVAIPGGGDLPPAAAPVNTRDGIAHCGQGADADTVWLTDGEQLHYDVLVLSAPPTRNSSPWPAPISLPS